MHAAIVSICLRSLRKCNPEVSYHDQGCAGPSSLSQQCTSPCTPCSDAGDATNSSLSTPANDVHSYDSNEDNALASSGLFKINEMFALQGIRNRNMSTEAILNRIALSTHKIALSTYPSLCFVMTEMDALQLP